MKVERFDCPVDFLKLMLTHLTSAFVNKVGERPHCEVADMGLLSGTSAIALAKAKARKGNNNYASQQPTFRACLVVGVGEGRVEVIWWPDMYSNQQREKLTLRYYVGKVMFTN